jgi:hypothetical protein
MAQKNFVQQDKASANGHEPMSSSSILQPPEQDEQVVDGSIQSREERVNNVRQFLHNPDEDDVPEGTPFLVSVLFGQPHGTVYFRVRDDKSWTGDLVCIDYRGDDSKVPHGLYALHPDVAKHVQDDTARKYRAVVYVTANGRMGVWLIKIVRGFGDQHYQAYVRIVEKAKQAWVNIKGQGQGLPKDGRESKIDYGEPQWQGESFLEVLDIAMGDRLVWDLDHPLCAACQIGR